MNEYRIIDINPAVSDITIKAGRIVISEYTNSMCFYTGQELVGTVPLSCKIIKDELLIED